MLRTKLKEITDNENVSSHYQEINAIRPLYNHRIDLLDTDISLADFNCYAYALRLAPSEIYQAIRSFGLGRIHADSNYVQHIIARGILQPVSQEQAQPSDIVIYFSADQPVHGGVLSEDEKVESKWGRGNLYVHRMWEVPISYGDSVRCFKDVDEEESVARFVEYASELDPRFRVLRDSAGS